MIALEFMVIACTMLLLSIPAKLFTTTEVLLFLCFWIGGSIVFNRIVQETDVHYKSYKYIFIIGGIYLITKHCYDYVKCMSYVKSLMSLVTSFGIGYILIILLLPIFHLYQFVKVNDSVWLGEFWQSFVVSVLSFLLFKIFLFVFNHLFNWYNSRYLSKIRDVSSGPYRFCAFVIHMFAGTKINFIIFIHRFVKCIITLLILMLFVGNHFEEPMSVLKSNIKYQNYPWIMKINSRIRGNIKLTNKLYVSNVYHHSNSIDLSSRVMRKDIRINASNNNFIGKLNNITYKHLGKLKSFKLMFNGVKDGTYYFNGSGYIWRNDHISSKAHIKLYLWKNINK